MKGNRQICKVISVCTLIVLCVVVMFTYIQYNDDKIYQSKYENIQNDLDANLGNYIETILQENKKKSENVLKIYGAEIKTKLVNTYNNEEPDLRYDINHPSSDSKLSEVLDEVLKDVYMNKDTNTNKPLVISMDNVLWNRSIYMNDTKHPTLSYFTKNHCNSKLCENALSNITNMNVNKNNLIFWESVNSNINSDITNSMDIRHLINIYSKYGINSLKNYELLVPVYITDTGDIFGTKDLDNLGKKVKNYKIILIQRVNIYDAIKPHMDGISKFQSQIVKIKNDITINKKERAEAMIISIIAIVFIIGSSAYLQNQIYNDK